MQQNKTAFVVLNISKTALTACKSESKLKIMLQGVKINDWMIYIMSAKNAKRLLSHLLLTNGDPFIYKGERGHPKIISCFGAAKFITTRIRFRVCYKSNKIV